MLGNANTKQGHIIHHLKALEKFFLIPLEIRFEDSSGGSPDRN
jgi:hypothetical protein